MFALMLIFRSRSMMIRIELMNEFFFSTTTETEHRNRFRFILANNEKFRDRVRKNNYSKNLNRDANE